MLDCQSHMSHMFELNITQPGSKHYDTREEKCLDMTEQMTVGLEYLNRTKLANASVGKIEGQGR